MTSTVPWSTRLSWMVGLSDGSTGLGLLLMPEMTLRLMQVNHIPTDLIFIRYIGAFVLSAGLMYGLPFLQASDQRALALRTIFQATILIRVLVTLICSAGLLTHQLDPAWISVPIYDATIATLQYILIRKELS